MENNTETKHVHLVFPRIPERVQFTLLNLPLYIVRKYTHRRAIRQTLTSFASALHYCQDDPKGYAHVVATALHNTCRGAARSCLLETAVRGASVINGPEFARQARSALIEFSKTLEAEPKKLATVVSHLQLHRVPEVPDGQDPSE